MRAKSLFSLMFAAVVTCGLPTLAQAQDDLLGVLPLLSEIREDEGAAALPTATGPAPVNVLLAVHRTASQRATDLKRRKPARAVRGRVQDDKNFTNRTRFLAHRLADSGQRPVELGVATTGEEFLDALVRASQKGPIRNLVIYGHAASSALFAREDRGFYTSVMAVAKESVIVSGTQEERDEQLRAAGARDLSDFEWLLARGDIRFTR